MLWGREEYLRKLRPSIVGGGAVDTVSETSYALLDAPDKFEPGTPNLVGAVSLLKAIERMELIGEEYLREGDGLVEQKYREIPHPTVLQGRYSAVHAQEAPLIAHTLEEFHALASQGVQLVGTAPAEKRIGLFSFILPTGKFPTALGQYAAQHQVCLRCGGQCAHILHHALHQE